METRRGCREQMSTLVSFDPTLKKKTQVLISAAAWQTVQSGSLSPVLKRISVCQRRRQNLQSRGVVQEVHGHGGRPDSDLDPPPPSPPIGRSNLLRWSGPRLAQTWRRRRRDFFFWCMVGFKNLLHPVCMLKMLRILWGIQMYIQNGQTFFTPDLPPPSPKSGCWDWTPSG